MAFSSSIKRAQAIILCELCNEDSIKWRCVDCEMCLCEKCKIFHLRVPTTAKHQIVTITTPILDVPRRIVTDNIPCKDHVENLMQMFCKNCDCLVYSECVSTSHTRHQFTPIEKALDGKMKKLKSTQANFIDSLKPCDSKSLEFQRLMPKFNSIFDDSVAKIKQKERELKDVISKFSKSLQDNVEAERSKVKSRFTKIERKIDNNIVTTNEISMEINEMALTSDNEILMTEFDNCDVKLMTKTGEIKTFITLKPLFLCGIHITRDNHIIVGVIERGNLFTPTDQSQRAILVFDMEGKQRQKYQFDGYRQRLFTVPARITTNNNQDILVLDWTSNITGRMVTLDREGDLKWIYEGHPKINDTTQFCPCGITTTAAEFIIANDVFTHVLHVLSENGDVLTCKVMDDIGIIYPWALKIDKWGKLWVGCQSGQDSGAKLHIVKMLI